MYFIQETDKPNPILKIFDIIKMTNDKLTLPITDKPIRNKKAEKLARKTKKIMDKTACNKLVISEKIKQQKTYINCLYTQNIEIIDGKWLFQVLSCDILEYILAKKNLIKEETTVAILINQITEYSLSILETIVKDYKRVVIVTNHIQQFEKIEKQILEELGIAIVVTNNKKKSLAKIPLILNLDFPEELINQFNLFENAILINVKFKVKIAKKRFQGICINDYEIMVENNEEFDKEKERKFSKKELYEARFYQRQPWKQVRSQIQKDKVKVKYLVGQKSKIEM